MNLKWIGALLVVLGCGGYGCLLSAQQQKKERLIQQMVQVVSFMTWELQYRLTPLPELCKQAGRETDGSLRAVFTELGQLLDGGTCANAAGCVSAVIRSHRELPDSVRGLLRRMGHTLGRFDLPGQLDGLAALRLACDRELEQLAINREIRLRNYRTLGLCAGAALIIIFI